MSRGKEFGGAGALLECVSQPTPQHMSIAREAWDLWDLSMSRMEDIGPGRLL